MELEVPVKDASLFPTVALGVRFHGDPRGGLASFDPQPGLRFPLSLNPVPCLVGIALVLPT